MPKKPLNAYILFFMDYAKKNIADGSYIKVLPDRFMQNVLLFSIFFFFKQFTDCFLFQEASKVGSIWASLPDSEKAKWNELAAAQDKEYKKKLEKWEAEMVAQGHLEVIHTKGKP